MQDRHILRQLAMIAVLALTVGGCGRRGALEPPPGLAAAPEAAQKPASDSLAPARAHRPPPIQPGTEPFVLDPLL